MSKAISPVLRRASLVSGDLAPALARAFADPALRGILVPLWVDDTQCLPCLAPRFLVAENDLRQIKSWDCLRQAGRDAPELAMLGMDLMGHQAVHAAIDEVVNALPICVGAHHVDLLLMRDAAILFHDDIDAYIEDHADYLLNEPGRETTRAPLCTLIVPVQQSAHAALCEAERVARDLEEFRLIHTHEIERLETEFGLTLAAPSPAELIGAEALS